MSQRWGRRRHTYQCPCTASPNPAHPAQPADIGAKELVRVSGSKSVSVSGSA